MQKSILKILIAISIGVALLAACNPESKLPQTENLHIYWGERLKVEVESSSQVELFLNSKKLADGNVYSTEKAVYFDLIRPKDPKMLKSPNLLELKDGKNTIKRYNLIIDGRIRTGEMVIYSQCKDIKDPLAYESLLKQQLKLDFKVVSFYQTKPNKRIKNQKIDCLAALKFDEKALSAKELVNKLKSIITRYSPAAKVEYNYVNINDQSTSGFFDPKCMQATTLLSEEKGATAISLEKLVRGGIINLPAGNGQGVRIAVLDSGISSSQNAGGFIDLDLSRNFSSEENILDGVNCKSYPHAPEPGFLAGGHGQQVVKLIHAVASGATLTMLKVCDSFGECSSSNVSTALLYLRDLAQNGVKYDIINMSLGNENASFISQAVLSDLFDLSPTTILVASAGNNATDSEHYPASLANNAAYSENILGIAAAKLVGGSFVIADINTGRQVSSEITSLMAPGINLLISGSPSPLTGTSFAAPLATAIIARKKQASSNLIATDIHNQCLPSAANCNYEMVQ